MPLIVLNVYFVFKVQILMFIESGFPIESTKYTTLMILDYVFL